MALRTASDAREGVSSLPVDVTSFVGRRTQIADAKRLLSGARLLTLTGPGGVGKTRLALRVAYAVRRAFGDGVRFVELAELREPSLLAYAVAEKLGLQDRPFQSALETIVEHLQPREVLLVLDNCEHMAEDTALFVDAVLGACPQVRILATSRQPLEAYGETTLVVPPLPVPEPDVALSPDALMLYDSVALFAERARAVLPGFDVRSQDCAVLARVCRDLDGIPLAIELAVVWLRALSLDQIAERLSERFRLLARGPRNVPPRQRTLRSMVEWSYDLCSEPEKRVWARASVFSGGFDLAAVEYVGGGEEADREAMADTVRSLVDKSILIREEAEGVVRYRMLETMREYGQERLVSAGEDIAMRRRHRDWCVRLVDRFEAEWIGPDQEVWVRHLRREHANLRIALDFCLAQPGEAHVALRMAVKIDDYWSIRGIYTEARHWLDHALTASPEPTNERVLAMCLNAVMRYMQGDHDAALTMLAEADELLEQSVASTAERAYVMLNTGIVLGSTADVARGISLIGDAVSGFRTANAARGQLHAQFLLGLALGLMGERERGLTLLDECLAKTSRWGETYWRSWALWALAFIEVDHDPERAEAAISEALGVQSRMQSKTGIAMGIDILAWVNARQGRHRRAATLFGVAAALWDEMGVSPDSISHQLRMTDQQFISTTRAALGDDGYDEAFRRGYQLSEQRAVDYALEKDTPVRTTAHPREEETPLTPREQQISALLAEGLSNKEIAARLVIAQRTAESHVDHILTKLGFTSRAQVASWFTVQNSAPPTDG